MGQNKPGSNDYEEYSTFPKAPGFWEPYRQMVYCHIQDTHWLGADPFAAVQSAYSTDLADWTDFSMKCKSPYIIVRLSREQAARKH